MQADDDAAIEATTALGGLDVSSNAERAEVAAVDKMVAHAERKTARSDAAQRSAAA